MVTFETVLQDRKTFRLEEYKTLRGEILTRIRLRQQLVAITLTLAGAFLAVGLNISAIALIYPPLAMFLAFGWVQNDRRIRDAAYYILEHIEKSIPVKGWETLIAGQSGSSIFNSLRFTVFSHGGIFLMTQVMAIGIGVSKFTKSPVEWGLLGLDVISVGLVIWLMYKIRK